VRGWGAEQLTREELLNLGAKLRSAWDASVRQANRSHYTAGRAWRHFAAASEMAQLWGEVADELIVRRPERAAQAPGWVAVCEPEAGS
jgi:hypothetical protein